MGAAHGTSTEAASALATQQASTAAAGAAAGAALKAHNSELRALRATGTQLLGKLGALLAQQQAGASQAAHPGGGWRSPRLPVSGREALLARLRAKVRAGEARLQGLCNRVAALVP